MPSMKTCLFAGSTTEKRDAHSWADMATHLCRYLPDQNRTTLGAQCIFRGAQSRDFWMQYDKLETRLHQKLSCLYSPLNIEVSYLYGVKVQSIQKSIDVCYNSTDIIHLLNPIYQKSRTMYDQRAYLHWYQRFADTETAPLFEEAFYSMGNVLDQYSSL